ncbi:MAG: hypothetical protein KC609_25375 [Myxococcales bacterium]|nr:hypothetical protein [Myxococcales bacterium]
MMKRWHTVVGMLILGAAFAACGGSGSKSGVNPVTNEEFKIACDNGVTLCKDDPQYGQTFGAQDCSTSAIETAYAVCDTGCRANSRAIIDCQKVATSCDAFAGCVQ